ncbi:hypothetical protein O181_018201 [Austropuccinia psidii MF-1]|uniref:Integrase catalytic domain-containing protein n=1 Tax=Austropuccinia psidii MF-1 TaxID=1389203 RepID=A0A9Q3C4U5_9BASI|nr:hypothetical protein [Austropuccinia psidii MF-1]
MHIDYMIPTAHLMVNKNVPHQRPGCPGIAVLKYLGLPINNPICTVCKLNNVHKQSFNEKFENSLLPLDCVHNNLVGPIDSTSISGLQYFLLITDQATSYKIAKFLGKKLDAFAEFLVAKTYLENKKDQRLKKLISDSGGEFLNKIFEQLSREHLFVNRFFPPEAPQHKGFAKISNRTILEKGGCLLGSCNLSAKYWEEVVKTSFLFSNLIPMQSRENKSPHYLWIGQEPTLRQLKIFGCLAFITIPRHHHD